MHLKAKGSIVIPAGIEVLIGNGLRLFENIDPDKIKLERVKVVETTTMRTSITFRVTKAN